MNRSIHRKRPLSVWIETEMEKRGWRQADLASVLGIPQTSLSSLLCGQMFCSADRARQLAAAFAASPYAILQMESEYRLSLEPDPSPEIKARLQAVLERKSKEAAALAASQPASEIPETVQSLTAAIWQEMRYRRGNQKAKNRVAQMIEQFIEIKILSVARQLQGEQKEPR